MRVLSNIQTVLHVSNALLSKANALCHLHLDNRLVSPDLTYACGCNCHCSGFPCLRNGSAEPVSHLVFRSALSTFYPTQRTSSFPGTIVCPAEPSSRHTFKVLLQLHLMVYTENNNWTPPCSSSGVMIDLYVPSTIFNSALLPLFLLPHLPVCRCS